MIKNTLLKSMSRSISMCIPQISAYNMVDPCRSFKLLKNFTFSGGVFAEFSESTLELFVSELKSIGW